MSVFVDTGAFLAYRNKRDKYHRIASKLFRDALGGKYGQIYTSDYIFDEALTLALVRTNNIAVAMDIAEVILSPRIRMVFVDPGILEKSTKTFKQYSDRNLSFTDAVSIEIMNEFDIEKYLGFDAHFNGIVEKSSFKNSTSKASLGVRAPAASVPCSSPVHTALPQTPHPSPP